MKQHTKKINQPDVSKFDYAKMAGQSGDRKAEREHFDEYHRLHASLLMNEKYDYEMWLASATFAEQEVWSDRLGKDVKVKVLVGVRLNGNKPVQITRMSKRMADEINKNVSTDYQVSKYVFLAKEANIELARGKEVAA